MPTARVLKLPQTYWAPITTMMITQSSLGATLAVSWQRFIGTVVGAVLGALVASHSETNFGLHVSIQRFALHPIQKTASRRCLASNSHGEHTQPRAAPC